MERRTPAGGFKGAGLGSLALAAALAVGPLTAGLRAAEPAATPKAAATPAPSVPAPAPTPAPAAKTESARIAIPAPATKPTAPPATKPVPAPPPLTAEQIRQEQERKAAALLNDAKQAYEQKNYGPSVANYRQFLSQFPKRPEVMAAHYGLAMALAEMPDKDWVALIGELQTVLASPEVADK